MNFKIATSLLLIGFMIISCNSKPNIYVGTALEQYYQNNIDSCITILQGNLKLDKSNVETLTWLAQSYSRKGDFENSKKYSAKALSIEENNAFANLVYGKSILPHYTIDDISSTDSSWNYYMKAIECDSTNPNIWVEVWGTSIRKGDINWYKRSIHKLFETKFLTDVALAYGEWMLKSLPQNTILITNGDMDTYPPQALQEVKAFRNDVIIVERGLLDLSWSIRFLRDELGLPILFNDKEIKEMIKTNSSGNETITLANNILDDWFKKFENGQLDFNIAFAPTVNPQFYEKYNDYIVNCGSYFLLKKKVNRKIDLEEIKNSLENINKEKFSGKWISPKDLSPIRTIYTKRLVRNITYSGIIYCEELIKLERFEEVKDMLKFLEDFENGTELGLSYTDKFKELRESIKTQR